MILISIPSSKFRLGQIVVTSNANASLSPEMIQDGLQRHAAGDWGNVCADDAELNNQALVAGPCALCLWRRWPAILDHH